MTTRRDPLAESFRAALDAEAAGDVGAHDDDALLARAIDRALASAAPPVGDAAAPPRVDPRVKPDSTGALRTLGAARAARLRALRYALPAAAALVATVAMAAVYMRYREPPSNDVTHLPRESAPPPAAPPAPVAPVAPASEGTPSISVDDLPTVAPRGSGPAAREAPSGAASATATAAELFRDGNAARRAGDVDKAVELYEALVTRHPGTAESHAARVSLGRLLLDRRGDAAGALVQFDAYLKSSSSDRALAEEARLGRALVFQRQGLQEEERRAWYELLERHPDSLYASRARERLRALAPADVAPALSSPPP